MKTIYLNEEDYNKMLQGIKDRSKQTILDTQKDEVEWTFTTPGNHIRYTMIKDNKK